MRSGRYIGTPSAPLLRPYFSQKTDTSILRIGKLVHCEVASVLYAKLQFAFSSASALDLFLTNIGAQNGACITSIILEFDVSSHLCTVSVSWAHLMAPLPKLNKLVLCVDVVILEYLDRKANVRSVSSLWTADTRPYTIFECIEHLKLLAQLLVREGADEVEKRKKFDVLEFKIVDEKLVDDVEFQRNPEFSRSDGVSLTQRRYNNVLIGVREDVEKWLVKEGLLAASSSAFDTKQVCLKY